jgi:hypothetical protein
MITRGFRPNFFTQEYIELLYAHSFPWIKINDIVPFSFTMNALDWQDNVNAHFIGFLTMTVEPNTGVIASLNGVRVATADLQSGGDSKSVFSDYAHFDHIESYATTDGQRFVQFIGWKISLNNVPIPAGLPDAPPAAPSYAGLEYFAMIHGMFDAWTTTFPVGVAHFTRLLAAGCTEALDSLGIVDETNSNLLASDGENHIITTDVSRPDFLSNSYYFHALNGAGADIQADVLNKAQYPFQILYTHAFKTLRISNKRASVTILSVKAYEATGALVSDVMPIAESMEADDNGDGTWTYPDFANAATIFAIEFNFTVGLATKKIVLFATFA